MLSGCASLSEPSTGDETPTCAALNTIAVMGNFVRTAHMDEEVRVALKGYLTTLKSQMATIAELKQCQALMPSAPPSNSASLPSGIEGGASCGCDATGAAFSGTVPCERRAGADEGAKASEVAAHPGTAASPSDAANGAGLAHGTFAASRAAIPQQLRAPCPGWGRAWLRCGCRGSQRAS